MCLTADYKALDAKYPTMTAEVISTFIDLNNGLLRYNNNEINAINANGSLYFKATDVAKLLGYTDVNRPISKHIEDYQKITYANLIEIHRLALKAPLADLTYNDKNTIYLDESGVYTLLNTCRFKEAKHFKKWIVSEVLPQIRKTGTYALEAPLDVSKLNFYEESSIYDYDNTNVVYIAYIGIVDDEHMFKYGISKQVFIRDFKQHKKRFPQFQISFIIHCDNKEVVENEFTKYLLSIDLLQKKIISGKKKDVELFKIPNQYAYDKVIDELKSLVERCPLPSVKQLEAKASKNETEMLHCIEKEKTKQLELETRQVELVEKTKQDQIKLEILKMELMLKNTTQCTNCKDVPIEQADTPQISNSEETLKDPEDEVTSIIGIKAFIDRYCLFGEDISSNDKFRIRADILYEFYSTKTIKPILRKEFDDYLHNTMNLQSKAINWMYVYHITWLGIKLKDDNIKETQFDIYLRQFIENECVIDSYTKVNTKLFHEAFGKYCRENNYEPTKYNGWSTQRCRLSLTNKLGFIFSQYGDDGHLHAYSGLQLKSMPPSFSQIVEEFFEKHCYITEGARVIRTELNATFKTFMATNYPIVKYTRENFYKYIDETYAFTFKTVDGRSAKGYVGIMLK